MDIGPILLRWGCSESASWVTDTSEMIYHAFDNVKSFSWWRIECVKSVCSQARHCRFPSEDLGRLNCIISCSLTGVADIDPTGDPLLDTFLQLPTDVLAVMQSQFAFSAWDVLAFYSRWDFLQKSGHLSACRFKIFEIFCGGISTGGTRCLDAKLTTSVACLKMLGGLE